MRKIFIDGGAHNGSTRQDFIDHNVIDETSEVFSFEPSPLFTHAPYPHETKAIWIEEGQTEFYVNSNDQSSGLVKENWNWTSNPDPFQTYTVETFDFSAWMRESFESSDYIVAKFDIEGAEYAVLEKMIKEGTHLLVNRWFIEFHGWILPFEYQAREFNILRHLHNEGWFDGFNR